MGTKNKNNDKPVDMYPYQSEEQKKKSQQIIARATKLAETLGDSLGITDAQLVLSYANNLLRMELLAMGTEGPEREGIVKRKNYDGHTTRFHHKGGCGEIHV